MKVVIKGQVIKTILDLNIIGKDVYHLKCFCKNKIKRYKMKLLQPVLSMHKNYVVILLVSVLKTSYISFVDLFMCNILWYSVNCLLVNYGCMPLDKKFEYLYRNEH